MISEDTDRAMMKKLHLFAIVTALVIVAAQCYLEELPLMAREPERVFDLERDTAFGEGPYPDSRVYYRNPRYKRSVNETTLPVFGNINVLGTYFTIITVANSTMRVVVVRFGSGTPDRPIRDPF